jgi:metal-responsive CopG/Arc/MetJ family transcriptional regulator
MVTRKEVREMRVEKFPILLRVTRNELDAMEILSKREGVQKRSELFRLILREALASRGLLPVGLIQLEK